MQVTIVVVSDVMLGRKVTLRMLQYDDYTWPFHGTVDVLRNADLTLGNLEGPIIPNCEPTDGRMVFCADPQAIEGLVWAGFDGLSLANNHRIDYHEIGYERTVANLEEAGIAAIANDRDMVREINGMRIGVMGLDDTLSWLRLDELIPAVEAAAQDVDVLIGLVHWGHEYHAEPSERQVLIGQAMIDAGMDVIAGSHPHRVQPMEVYHSGLIFYSLGNFVFDQMWSEETREGRILRLTLTVRGKGEIAIDYELIPVKIFNYGQPRLEPDWQTETDYK